MLSLKDSWTEADLRQLLIEKDQGGERVSYHSRDCIGEAARDNGKKVSSFCDVWFYNISSKKTKEEFFKEERGKLQERVENDRSEEESEEMSCDKVFDGEANREDEQTDVVERDDEQNVGRDEEQKRDEEESKSCDEIQLGANSKSKHQAARFALNQQKT